jgi:tryptophan halogenase
MKYRLGVIGVGTAGIVSLSKTIQLLSNQWDIISIYDPNQKILGIGESTNPNFLGNIQLGLNFNLVDDLDKLDGTFKFGTKYINWRETDWVNPLFGSGQAIHFNNFKLKEFAFERMAEMWPEKFKTMEGKVESVKSTFTKAIVIIDGREEEFDYVIDCRGFPDDYTDYVISECSPVNHALIHSVEPYTDEPYTQHIATPNGWTFGIPLTNRHTYGYMFNDTITTKEEAIADMRTMFPDVSDNPVEYTFKSYYAKKVLDGRVLKNGNRALFFEPLGASSIYMYVEILEMFTAHLRHMATANPYSVGKDVNSTYLNIVHELEELFAFFYHGGSTFNTPFWNFAQNRALQQLRSTPSFENRIAENRKYHAMGVPYESPGWFYHPANLRIIDEKLNYNYFKS